ncbi:MAG: hypothetical protein MRY32_09160 [Rickettsiales bacterium]|nr:hypothetical protein [Rickettsiales bacterium]
MNGLKHSLLTTIALSVLSSAAYAEEEGVLHNWNISGHNTARGEVYDIDGNKAASPYPNGGSHGYNEFGINAARQYSPYERVNINLQGVLNGSDYRGVDSGFVPERIQFLYENGEEAVPFRVHIGDFYAGVSYRSLQRSLKGASVEFQPFTSRQRKHSILFFSGTNNATYRSLDIDNDYYSGASWLIEDREWGRLSFNLIHAYQDEPNGALTGANNSQMIYSAAVETPFDVMDQKMIFEGEMAFFDGDYGLLEDQTDTGAFAQLSGRSRSMPLDYRFRFERYGVGYRPNGAIITPDRRSYEAHAGWRFDWGAYLRGRAQRFEDNFDSTNKTRTDLIGANLSGPMLNSVIAGLTGNIDIYQQQVDNAFNTVDRDTDTLNASFNMPITDGWNGQVTGYLQDADDRTGTNADVMIRQFGVGVYTNVQLGDLSGTINPGVVVRAIDNNIGSDSNEIHPTINVNLANNTHRVNANYGILSQNRISSGAPDIATQTAGLEYAYMFGDHEIGVNGAYYDREVNAARDTDAWKAGIYWTMRFNKPAGRSLYGTSSAELPMSNGAVQAPELKIAGLGLMKDLEPGGLLNRATVLLKENDITTPTKREGVYAYEASLIDEVIERQRLVLEHGGGKVQKSALVIDVNDTGSPRSVEQLYERVKQILVRQYGQPDYIYEKGDFTMDVANDINTEQVIRVVEWNTPEGKLRYGMPRRLDGQIRIELQHAKQFQSARQTLWSSKLF